MSVGSSSTILLGSSATIGEWGGGIGAFVNDLVVGFTRRNWHVILATPTAGALRPPPLHGCVLVPTDRISDPLAIVSSLARVLQEYDVNLIVNNDNPHVQALAPIAPCPFLSIGHLARWSIATLTCWQHVWVDHVVAISGDMHRTFVERHGVPAFKCPVLHTGIDLARLPRRSPRHKDRHLRLVFVGGDQRRKGADLVGELLTRSFLAKMDIELDWFGAAPTAKSRGMAALQDTGQLRTHGVVGRTVVQRSLADADVLLFPSREEGCPISLIEAMALGVVPVAADGLGAMREIIAHGFDGLLFPANRWVDGVERWLEFIALRRSTLLAMSEAATRKASTDYSIDEVVDRLCELAKRPTVDRAQPATSIDVLQWHRPAARGGMRGLLDRGKIVLGVLTRAGTYSPQTDNNTGGPVDGAKVTRGQERWGTNRIGSRKRFDNA